MTQLPLGPSCLPVTRQDARAVFNKELFELFTGDYFGILKEEKVTSFPFSVMDNPMYWGSTACYLGWSIM